MFQIQSGDCASKFHTIRGWGLIRVGPATLNPTLGGGSTCKRSVEVSVDATGINLLLINCVLVNGLLLHSHGSEECTVTLMRSISQAKAILRWHYNLHTPMGAHSLI